MNSQSSQSLAPIVQSRFVSVVLDNTPQSKGPMKLRYIGVTIVVVAVIFFFMLPVVPYTARGMSLGGPTVTATVSPSYYYFGCGIAIDITVSASLVPASGPHTEPSGWYCSGL
jgi:hypothetical protein